jgi:1-deoxy-D-xylulose-5-phosphate reductoisomerase
MSTLEVVDHLRSLGEEIQVVALAACSNHEQLAAQAKRHGVEHVALADESAAQAWAQHNDIEVISGADAARELVARSAQPGDLLVAAIVGAAGISAVLEGIERGCDIALANKETLVAAGSLVMPAVAKAGVHMLPIDSEHSALFQCLAQRLSQGDTLDDVRRVVLTASGGPFRGRDRASLMHVTPEEALAHPTWSMGPKVTIDSATLVNKALEVIEAHWLFGLGRDRIEAIVHPQSIVHGMVEFRDSSVLAQMGPPDMKTPIQVAMTWPRRLDGVGTAMDWTALRQLDFEPIDHEVFPSIDMAWDVIEQGGSAGAVFNGANEAAVDAFLAGRIRFDEIWDCIREAIEMLPAAPVLSVQDVMAADASARDVVGRRVEALAAGLS